MTKAKVRKKGITAPWSRSLTIGLTKYKAVEVQISHWPRLPRFAAEFRVRRRRDHPGILLRVRVFGVDVAIDYFDNRHWDHQSQSLEKDSDE